MTEDTTFPVAEVGVHLGVVERRKAAIARGRVHRQQVHATYHACSCTASCVKGQLPLAPYTSSPCG